MDIKEGDIVTMYNGQELDQTHGLNEFVLASKAGDKVSLTIERNGEVKNIDVVLGENVK